MRLSKAIVIIITFLLPTSTFSQQQTPDNEEMLLKTLNDIAPLIKTEVIIGGGSMQYNLRSLELALNLSNEQRFAQYFSMPLEANVRLSIRNGFISFFYQTASAHSTKDNTIYNVTANNIGIQLGYSFLLMEEDWTLYPFCTIGANTTTFTAGEQTTFQAALQMPIQFFTISQRNGLLGIGVGTKANIVKWKRGDNFLPISALLLGWETSYNAPIGGEAYNYNLIRNINNAPFMAQQGWLFKVILGFRF